MDRAGPTVSRMLLGGQLRRLRDQQGFDQRQAARVIGCSVSKISRLEQGKLPFKEAEVAVLLDLYGVTAGAAREKFLEMARDANAPGWWESYSDAIPKWFGTYVGLESAASLIWTFEPQLIPGLLQTEGYMRAITGEGPGSPRRIGRRVELRQERQKKVIDSDTNFWAVIDEGALRRPIGGRNVMREQLDELLRLMHWRSTLRIQVLPFVRTCASGQVAFSYFRFAEREIPELSHLPRHHRELVPYLEVVYHEHLTDAVYMDKPEEVEKYRAVFEKLTLAALLVDEDSVELISRIRAEL